jgi:hypothetical protein
MVSPEASTVPEQSDTDIFAQFQPSPYASDSTNVAAEELGHDGHEVTVPTPADILTLPALFTSCQTTSALAPPPTVTV